MLRHIIAFVPYFSINNELICGLVLTSEFVNCCLGLWPMIHYEPSTVHILVIIAVVCRGFNFLILEDNLSSLWIYTMI